MWLITFFLLLLMPQTRHVQPWNLYFLSFLNDNKKGRRSLAMPCPSSAILRAKKVCPGSDSTDHKKCAQFRPSSTESWKTIMSHHKVSSLWHILYVTDAASTCSTLLEIVLYMAAVFLFLLQKKCRSICFTTKRQNGAERIIIIRESKTGAESLNSVK